MALSILESDRIDRYDFEIFIGQVNFKGFKSKVSDQSNANNQNDVEKSGLKVNQL